LIDNGFLSSNKDSLGRYNYRVNKHGISSFLQSENTTVQSNNTKNENKKVMTRKEKVFRHIEENGNAMRYTDIIKFAYEDKYGKGTFDKKRNRGHYSGAFSFHTGYPWYPSFMKQKAVKPKGHFVTPTSNGYLWKLSNGLWAVQRPLGWKREDVTTTITIK
jgi:hypothetical protein